MPTTQDLMARVESLETTPEELAIIAEELATRFADVKTPAEAADLVTLSKHLAKRLELEIKANDATNADAAALEVVRCEHCHQEWSLQEPEPLTRFCEHGGLGDQRLFATCARVATRTDGRVKLQLDLHGNDGGHVICLLSEHSAARLRAQMAKGHQGYVVGAWAPE